jgi:hypothetical protein
MDVSNFAQNSGILSPDAILGSDRSGDESNLTEIGLKKDTLVAFS